MLELPPLRTARQRVAVASLAMVIASMSACSSGGAAAGSSTTVTFISWGGSYQEAETKAWIDPFQQESGVHVIQDSPTDYSKLRTMVEARRVSWDVVDVEGDFGLAADAKYLEPIDYGVVDQAKILPGLASKYRVGIELYSVVLGYNTTALNGRVPQGWADFFDMNKFPCKRAVQKKASSGILEIALLAQGVAPAQIYPIDVNPALNEMDKIKDSIVWWDTGSQAQELLASGEVCMAAIFNGRAYAAKTSDQAPVAVNWTNQVLSADYLVVPKGSPHRESAMKLIAYIISPGPQSRLSDYITYAPINSDASPNPVVAQDLPTTHLEGSVRFDDAWWEQNFSAVDQRFQAWLLG